MPKPGPEDLLVRVRAVALNPVDTKVRRGLKPEDVATKILGWDAAGIVERVGSGVAGFRPGDAVYYAGDIGRQGSYAEFQLVDYRIAAVKPAVLDFEPAAALPLTAITAWEGLFERLCLGTSCAAGNGSLLIIGGAGGLGSIATQLAKRLTPLTVIATASRAESVEWCARMGADHVIDHTQPLARQLEARGIPGVDYIFCLADTDAYWERMADVILPQGRICCVVSARRPLDMNIFKNLSVAVGWEFMFTRAMYRTPDMGRQGAILAEVARLVDAGTLRSTLGRSLGTLTAESVGGGHALLESGHTVGKLTLSVP